MLSTLLFVLFITGIFGFGNEVELIPIETEPSMGSSAVFLCSMEKPLQTCEIKPPYTSEWTRFNDTSILKKAKGLQDHNRFLYYGDGLEKGDCGLVLQSPRTKDNGTWSCRVKAIGQKEYHIRNVNITLAGDIGEKEVDPPVSVSPDDVDHFKEESDEETEEKAETQAKVSVVVTTVRTTTSEPTFVLNLNKVRTAPKKADPAVFLCSLGHPLEYCEIKPPYTAYSTRIDGTTIGKERPFLYYGNGLLSGDCGVIIQNPERRDNGTWTCILKPKNGNRIFTEEIQISVADDMNTKATDMKTIAQPTVMLFQDSPNPTPQEKDDEILWQGAILGAEIVVAVVIILVLIVGAVFAFVILCKKYKNKIKFDIIRRNRKTSCTTNRTSLLSNTTTSNSTSFAEV